MSIEGLWIARFGDYTAPNSWENGGVIVIESGRILGGDSGTYYLGNVSIDGEAFQATFTVTIYDKERSQYAFGNFKGPIEVHAEGKREDDVISGKMTYGGINLAFNLSKKADLP